MPRGGPRPGSGRKPLPLETHVLRGSYRKDRHGPLPASVGNVALMPAPVASWHPEAAELRALPRAGRVIVGKLLAAYEFSTAEGALLLELGQAVGSLEAVRGTQRGGLSVREAIAMEKLEIAWQRQVAALIAQLRVQP